MTMTAATQLRVASRRLATLVTVFGEPALQVCRLCERTVRRRFQECLNTIIDVATQVRRLPHGASAL
jgi:hypothetical protein